ncbi:MAG TPA: hypothetical protein VHP11_04055, partial [Tepidisphaeraceae bacterium]|nr:hypothetical protein [Tepidisphaeraceae bacterium]
MIGLQTLQLCQFTQIPQIPEIVPQYDLPATSRARITSDHVRKLVDQQAAWGSERKAIDVDLAKLAGDEAAAIKKRPGNSSRGVFQF